MKLGVLQGRLQPPESGHIQEFPTHWMVEFRSLIECGLECIEWIITKGSFDTNPVLSSGYALHNLPISSVCVDHMIDERVFEKDFLEENLIPVCESAMRQGIPCITIPLLEESSMESPEKRRSFAIEIDKIASLYPHLKFSFEAELGIAELHEIVSQRENFYVTYDTGNITSYGLDHDEYVKNFSTKINNVHLKDRTFDARTVQPLTGDTDFRAIFMALNKIGYSGTFILQTARGAPGKEKETIMNHKRIFEDLYAEVV